MRGGLDFLAGQARADDGSQSINGRADRRAPAQDVGHQAALARVKFHFSRS